MIIYDVCVSMHRYYFEVLCLLGTGLIEDVDENKTWFLTLSS